MLAWETAVAVNTAASFETFLASYANSDLAATARKMQQRVLNRSLAQPTNIALGPTCPCPTPPTLPLPLQKKVETPPPAKQVEKSSRKRRAPPDYYYDDDVGVERGPPGPPPGYVRRAP